MLGFVFLFEAVRGRIVVVVFPATVIIPKLADVATMNNISQNTTKRKDIALTLLDAFSNMSECCILETYQSVQSLFFLSLSL